MNDMHDKVAIITGASRGLGAEFARRLAGRGAAIIVNYAHGREAAEAVVAEIVQAGGRAVAVGAEIGTPGAAARLFDAAQDAFGGADILVNNAGMMANNPIADASDEEFHQQVALNVTGAFDGMREGARRLRDGGRIINISTSALGSRLPGYGVYVATKAAVEAMGAVLSKELGARGITVNAVAPGPTATELFFKGKSEQVVQAIAGMSPLKRIGAPSEIADVVVFLASAEAAWVNGQTVRVNGGMN